MARADVSPNRARIGLPRYAARVVWQRITCRHSTACVRGAGALLGGRACADRTGAKTAACAVSHDARVPDNGTTRDDCAGT